MIWFKKDIFKKKTLASGETDRDKSVRVPVGLWVKCESCADIIYKKDVEKNLEVCAKCGHHYRLPARARIELTIDEGTFKEQDAGMEPVDPLEFKDLKKYKDKLKAAQKETGMNDAIITGSGLIGGSRVFIAAFEFAFMGGSMGSVVGEKIVRLIECALTAKCGVVIFASSGGARMQEGILSLMQMAKTGAAIARLKDAGLPYISVLTDPTMGGVTASFAMLGDVIIAEPKALVGFAGPRVIAETIRQTLPEGFQRSEYLLEHGMIDMIVDRKHMKEILSRLLAMLAGC